jgi:hypothetical protein
VLRLQTWIYWSLLFFLLACSQEDNVDSVFLRDQDYLPLAVGHFQVYSVNETIYSNGPEGQLSTYQVKIEITDSLQVSEGVFLYFLQRASRNDQEDEWTPKNTWSARFSDREAIVQEGNIAFVKLVIPITFQLSWNGNKYNSEEEEFYTITKVGSPMKVGVVDYEDVVEVTHRNDSDNIVGKDIRQERYARGIGMISRKEEILTYCTNSPAPSCIGKQIIEQGKIVEYILLEYGKK